MKKVTRFLKGVVLYLCLIGAAITGALAIAFVLVGEWAGE